MHPVSKFESHEEQTLQFFTSKMRLLGERRYEAMQQSMIGKPSLIQTFGDDLPALSQLYRRVNDAWCLAFYLKKLKKWVPIHQYSPQIPMTLIRTMTTLLSLTVVTAAIDSSLCANPFITKTELRTVPSGHQINFTSWGCADSSKNTAQRRSALANPYAPLMKARDLEQRSASQCEIVPCSCGQTCQFNFCEQPPLSSILPTDCQTLTSALQSATAEEPIVFVQPGPAGETASFGTCETVFWNEVTTSSNQLCVDDWAALTLDISNDCPGQFAQCQQLLSTGLGDQWILQVTAAEAPLMPPIPPEDEF
ncbi:hypothetical protein SISSUDRAFT_1061793 [Sistotremastrum suecicum HHB10207 ss-3]|uniref:Uncharacterized protein n=1 Tax=Sistotremastrum suecicum HHB10207 ss-3 TaxID=1314776 RepID=A0A166DL18_9AGAM|nr:hypothetical protein SISSUDRAFT_1061793 [Sistotremastrum suecicum HHB10207 ss-3]